MVPDENTATGERTRRDVRRESAGVAAVGLTSLTAGCASALPPLGSEQRFGRVDAPPADPPTYRRWLPAPAEVEGDRPHYRVHFRRPTAERHVRTTVARRRTV